MHFIHRFLFLSLCLLAVVLTSCGGVQQNEKVPQAVRVATVTAVQTESEQAFPFISQPYRTSDLSFRVGGPVQVMDIHVGNFYRSGQTIAAIDPRDFELRRIRTEATAKQARAEFLRVESLFKNNNIAASVYDKASADHTAASTAAQAALNDLNDIRLKAPFNGYIQDIYFERFQDVRPGQAICSMIDIDRLKIETYVPQHIALMAQRTKSVKLRFDAMPDTLFTASIADVSKGTSKNNLSYLLTVILPNSTHTLLSGMSGNLSFEEDLPTVASVTAVPHAALRNRPSVGDYVCVVDEAGMVSYRSVRRGRLLKGGRIEIVTGLYAGEKVLISGQELIKENEPIITVSEPE